VKKDLLDRGWPQLYDLMRRDFAGLVQIEKDIQSPDEPAKVRLRTFLSDEPLVRLLKRRPYFRDFEDTGEPTTKAATMLAGTAEMSVAAAPAALTVATGKPIVPVEVPNVGYEDVSVNIRRSDATGDMYLVELKAGQEIVTSRPVSIPWDTFATQLKEPWSQENGALPSHDAPNRLSSDMLAQLKSIGLQLYDQLFRDEVRYELQRLLASSRNLRIHWDGDADNPASSMLPWECLHVPTTPLGFLALTRQYSLTRRNRAVRSMIVRPISGPLRMLFVSAMPQTVPTLPMVQREIESLEKLAKHFVTKVDLQVLQNASLARINETMHEFRPHIFHFSGHGTYQDGQGVLMLERQDGEADIATADYIAVLLHNHDVHVAFLNACETGVSSATDSFSSVSGALVRAGVPAVIATMRVVQDEQAKLFTRDFYRAFFAGFTLEGALAEARKALSLDHWDWAAYALFVGSTDVGALQVSTGLRSDAR
jgi:CHAT domain